VFLEGGVEVLSLDFIEFLIKTMKEGAKFAQETGGIGGSLKEEDYPEPVFPRE